MKKSSVLILIVTFILSIFLITFYGGASSDEHMKVYFNTVEILDYRPLPNGDGTYTKLIMVDFDTTESVGYTYINYRISPEDATESTAYKFKAVDGDVDLVTINGNRVEFSAPGSAIIWLMTTDNSNLHDSCLVICRENPAK